MGIKKYLVLFFVVGALFAIGYLAGYKYRDEIKVLLRNREEFIFKKGRLVAQCHKVFLGKVYYTYRATSDSDNYRHDILRGNSEDRNVSSSYHVKLLKGADPKKIEFDEYDCSFAKDPQSVWIAGHRLKGVDAFTFKPIYYKSKYNSYSPSGFYKDKDHVYYIQLNYSKSGEIKNINLKIVPEKPYLFKLVLPYSRWGIGAKGVYWRGELVKDLGLKTTRFCRYDGGVGLAIDIYKKLVFCDSPFKLKKLSLNMNKINAYRCKVNNSVDGFCYGDGTHFYDIFTCESVSADRVDLQNVVESIDLSQCVNPY